MSTLFFDKCSTACLLTLTCAISLNVHMLGKASVIRIVLTLTCFAVDPDGSAGMFQSADIRVRTSLLGKTLTAGIVLGAGMLAAHHDISLAASLVLIVHTVLYAAIQLSHVQTS